MKLLKSHSCFGSRFNVSLCTFFILLLFKEFAFSEVLFEKSLPFTPMEWNFSNIKAVSIDYYSNDKKFDLDIGGSVRNLLNGEPKIIKLDKTGPVDVNSLDVQVRYFAILNPINEKLHLLSTEAIVKGNTFNGSNASIPIFGTTYLLENTQLPEMQKIINDDLKKFCDLFIKTNQLDLKSVVFYY